MTISQVRKFARENDITESKIDEIKHDNFQNTAEEKTKLLQCWYQSHGKNGAYAALIRGLKKANCRAIIENIQAMVREDRENSTSDLSNENEGQRLEWKLPHSRIANEESGVPTTRDGHKMNANCIDTGNSWCVLFASKWQMMLSEGQMTSRFQRLLLLYSAGAEMNHFLRLLLFCYFFFTFKPPWKLY